MTPKVSTTPTPVDVCSILDQTTWPTKIIDFRSASKDAIYFNPSLAELDGVLWLFARRQINVRTQADMRRTIGMNSVWAFNLADKLVPQFGFKVKIESRHPEEQFEDPRAMIGPDGRIWISTCNFVLLGNSWTGAKQLITPIENTETWNCGKRYDPPFGRNGKGQDEKNWIWFFKDEFPHLVYWSQPHRVIRFDQLFEHFQEFQTDPKLPWAYGEIRGGTPPLLVDGKYWTFFHSSIPWLPRRRRYFMGAYCFSAKPPFAIERITPQPLLIGSHFDVWQPIVPLCVFPCGAVLKGNDWLVSFGVNDLACAIIQIPHKELFDRTVAV